MTNDGNKLQKKFTRKQLVRSLSNKPEDLFLCQLAVESYRPAMDSTKIVIEVYGNKSKFPLYASLNKQVAAKCQMNGINDPNATRRQRIAAITMFEDISESHISSIENHLTKEEMEALRNDRLTRTALFHGLGAKKDLKRRSK